MSTEMFLCIKLRTAVAVNLGLSNSLRFPLRVRSAWCRATCFFRENNDNRGVCFLNKYLYVLNIATVKATFFIHQIRLVDSITIISILPL